MLNGMKISKVAVVWATILYAVCVLVVGLLPSVYGLFSSYIVHFGTTVSKPEITFVSVLIGLILWNIVVFISVWLFVWLYNKMN